DHPSRYGKAQARHGCHGPLERRPVEPSRDRPPRERDVRSERRPHLGDDARKAGRATMIRRSIAAVVRAPAVHFLVIGALLFALVPRSTRPTVRAPIVITRARIAEVSDDYRRTMGVD